MAYWPPIRGDGLNQVERLTLAGLTASNTDRGKLYGDLTATTVDLYKDVSRGASDKVASGAHLAPSSWTKITLTESNTSGVSGSIWVKYNSADALWEVYPILATDTELEIAVIDFQRYPKQSAGTTHFNQHKRTREEFVRKMLQHLPPKPNAQLLVSGVSRGSRIGPWIVNSVGDFELKYLHNVEDYREWAIHFTIHHIARTVNHALVDTDQIRAIEDALDLADKAWAEVIPLYDDDADMDADREELRGRISRA
jgi:hypothetical protein